MGDEDPEKDQLESMRDALHDATTAKAVIDSNAEAIKAASDVLSGSSSSIKAIQEILNSPTSRAIQEILNSSTSRALQEAIDQLNALPKFDFHAPERVYDMQLPPPADERTVAVLQRVRAELEDLATHIAEGGRQTAAVVEVTKANLTALQTVIAELKESRKSSDRSSRALFWLTVALFVASAVAAVAVAPQVIKELASVWAQIQPRP